MAAALAQDSLDEAILTSLRRITRAVDIYSRQLASQHRLTGPQLVCLNLLRKQDELTSGHLAKAATLSAGTVTGILDRLEQRGYIVRTRSVSDKRQVKVRLTPAGRAAVENAPAPLQDRLKKSLAALTPRQQQEILDVLDRVVSMMGAADVDAAPLLATGPASADPAAVAAFLSGEVLSVPDSSKT